MTLREINNGESGLIVRNKLNETFVESYNAILSLSSDSTLVKDLTSQLMLSSDFNNFATEITSVTSTFLQTTTYENASGNWQSTYNTVQSNSATNWDNSLVATYVDNNFLPLSGGTLTGNLEVNVGDTTTTLYVGNSSVGINTENPNTALTVVGNISATGVFYGDGSNLTGITSGDVEATTLVRSNSANWETAYTTVNSNSATNWNYQGTDLKALSGDWNSAYTTVNSNSATWGTVGTDLTTVIDYLSTNNVFLSSAQIGSQTQSTTLFVRGQKVGINTNSPNQVLTVVGNVSSTGLYYGDGSQLTGIVAGDTVATTLVRSTSANWNLAPSTYTTVNSNSATNWNYQGTDLKALSGDWNSTYTTVNSNSATNWNYQGTDLKALSGNWNSAYTTVNSNSATNWNYQGTDLKALSGDWNSAYTTVNSNSATWGTVGTDLTTVIDYLSTNNVFLSSAQVGPQAQTTATLFARGYKVGINTESPNQALTVVGSVSATGSYYGDGSQLTGIVAGDTVATTLVRSNSASWDYQGTDLKALSANWQNTFTTVQTNSATWGSGGGGLYLPLSGGNLTGTVTTTSIISSTNVMYASGERVIVGQSTDTTPVYKIRAMTQTEYNALGTYDDNTIYFIKQ